MSTAGRDDLDRRRPAVRQRQLLMAVQQWAPGFQNVAGDWLSYVGEITEATEDERAFLRDFVAKHGMPDSVPRDWLEIRRAQGREANAAASSAFMAGDYARARDLVDDALAYGGIMEAEWRRLHEFIASRATPEAGAAQEPPAARETPAARAPRAA